MREPGRARALHAEGPVHGRRRGRRCRVRCALRRTIGKPGCEPVAGGLQGLAGRGQDLFVSEACISCHWADSGESVGPSFHGLAGSDVTLQSGKVVKADDRYLELSILAPDYQVVKGYQAGLMSSRIGAEHITRDQARRSSPT